MSILSRSEFYVGVLIIIAIIALIPWFLSAESPANIMVEDVRLKYEFKPRNTESQNLDWLLLSITRDEFQRCGEREAYIEFTAATPEIRDGEDPPLIEYTLRNTGDLPSTIHGIYLDEYGNKNASSQLVKTFSNDGIQISNVNQSYSTFETLISIDRNSAANLSITIIISPMQDTHLRVCFHMSIRHFDGNIMQNSPLGYFDMRRKGSDPLE